jgi:hypothetical protein
MAPIRGERTGVAPPQKGIREGPRLASQPSIGRSRVRASLSVSPPQEATPNCFAADRGEQIRVRASANVASDLPPLRMLGAANSRARGALSAPHVRGPTMSSLRMKAAKSPRPMMRLGAPPTKRRKTPSRR